MRVATLSSETTSRSKIHSRSRMRNTLAKIPEDVPVLIVTGSADQHARLSDVKELFSQVEWHAQLIVFDGAAHEPLYRYDPQLYESTLLRFLNDRIPEP